MSKALLTAVGPNMRPILADFSQATFDRFAETHGYEVVVADIAEDDVSKRRSDVAKQARWQKIRLLRETLAGNDLVAWFDADIMICRYDEDVADHMGDGDFQAITMQSVPAEGRVNPNSGVWVMRHCTEAFDFLDAVEEAGLPTEGPWADQAAIMQALGWIKGDEGYRGARPGPGSRYLAGTAWLPVGWNQPYMGDFRTEKSNVQNYEGRPFVDEPHAVHFMAMEATERRLAMSALATTLQN